MPGRPETVKAIQVSTGILWGKASTFVARLIYSWAMIEVLPIDAHLPAIRAAIRLKSSVILKAEPGAGKTSRVPPALLDVVPGGIIVLEPRRLAARLSAERVASELGEAVGERVGYQIRFEAKVSNATRVNFVTEGLFLRMVLGKPELPGISVIILDEFHERHLNTDLALGVVAKIQRDVRPDLKLLIMSATLDTAALERYLPDAAVFDVKGRSYPVRVVYRPKVEEAPLEPAVEASVRELLKDPECPGHILVFLTGIQEIRRTADHLAALAREHGADVLPLSAELPPREQARVFAPSSRRKIILSTNVAETSLTIPGVTGVVDSGKAKIAAHASWSGMPTLDVKRISQASCIQRAGRAGRTAPGVAHRLYSEGDYLGRPPFAAPDILRLDLAETALDVLALRRALRQPACELKTALPWFEAPDDKAAAAARQLLENLGVVDSELALTPRGERMAKIPLHPRLAAIIVKGQELGVAELALGAACLVSERMILGRNLQAVTHEDSDVHFQLDLLVKLARGEPITPRVLEGAIDHGRAQRVKNLYENLASRLGIGRLASAREVHPGILSACLLAGFPDRVALRRAGQKLKRDKEPTLYNFCMGRGGMLAESSVVKDQELILALDAAENQSRSADRGTVIYVAAGLSVETLLGSPSPLLRKDVETVWTPEAERVDVMQRVYYGEIVVRDQRVPVGEAHAAGIEELLRSKLAERWPKPFDDASDLTTYHVRAKLLRERWPEVELPVFEGEMLELLQAAIVEQKRSFKEIASKSLLAYIEEQLPYEQAAQLRKELPLEVALGNGRTLKVHYQVERPAYVSGTMQDFFGLTRSPALCSGALPLTVELLGPNKRPVQVTADLAGFWQRSYPALRSDLGRNYPRHYWPEDPARAEPHQHKSRALAAGQKP